MEITDQEKEQKGKTKKTQPKQKCSNHKKEKIYITKST